MRGRVWCAWLSAVLTVLVGARSAAAQLAYYDPGVATGGPVDVQLRSEEPSTELQLFRGRARQRGVTPAVVCYGSCAFSLLPGEYRLHVDGPAGSDIQAGSRAFQLEQPSLISVETKSSSAHWGGFAMGLAGPALIVLGTALVFASNEDAPVGSPALSSNKDTELLVGVGAFVGGLALAIGGWILFAHNRNPTLALTPLRPAHAR